MIIQFNARQISDLINAISKGKVFISAPRRSGKTSAISKFYKTHINWDVAVIVPFESMRYRYKQVGIHKVYLPEELTGQKFGSVFADNANLMNEHDLRKIIDMSEHVVIVSSPHKGSDFNKVIQDPDNTCFQFIGRDNPYLRAEMSEDRYREDVLGMIL